MTGIKKRRIRSPNLCKKDFCLLGSFLFFKSGLHCLSRILQYKSTGDVSLSRSPLSLFMDPPNRRFTMLKRVVPSRWASGCSTYPVKSELPPPLRGTNSTTIRQPLQPKDLQRSCRRPGTAFDRVGDTLLPTTLTACGRPLPRSFRLERPGFCRPYG